EEVKSKGTAARSIVVESKDEEVSTDSYFETLRLDVDHYAPKNESMRIIVRDVAEVKPEIENIVTVLPEVKASELAAKVVIDEKKAETAEPVKVNSVRVATRAPKAEKATTKKLSAKDLKEREISKAIRNASKLPESKKSRRKRGLGFGWVRTALVVSCIATGFFAIAYFVNLSANDMSLKVAAIQSGIEAVYPSYIPREFALSDVTASNGKILMNFKSSEGSAYSISEENTNWDSTALLNNYIKEEYGEDYTVVKEQGLTLYMGEGWEVWVNGGLLYKLKVNSGSLTKKQLKAIATSL
ncbi:MAG: hypothetical protein Q4B87_01780, partial [Candidatus Saccharibacteria bacterium]|nr:hypothetical protein [Candidatus Saccharibacteria bacterium]